MQSVRRPTLAQLSSLTSSLTSSLNSRAWQEQFTTTMEAHASEAAALQDFTILAREHGPLVASYDIAHRTHENVANALARTSSPEVLRTASAQMEAVLKNVQALSLAAQSVPAATSLAAETLSEDPMAVRFNRLVGDVIAGSGMPSASNTDLAAHARLLDDGLFHLNKVFATAEAERSRNADSVQRYASV